MRTDFAGSGQHDIHNEYGVIIKRADEVCERLDAISAEHSGSTMPSSRHPTLPSPSTRLQAELVTTRRFSNVAIGIVIGDILVHFLVWVLQ